MLRRIMPESYNDIREFDYCDKKGICNIELLEAEPIDHESIVQSVNDANLGWTAEVSSRFQGMTTQQIKGMMGTIVDPQFHADSPKLELLDFIEDVPESFDAREAFPECKSVINHIRD